MEKLIKFFEYLDNGFIKVQKIAVVILGSFMAFALVFTIATRVFINQSIMGLEEVVLIAAVWFYMIGAAITSSERSHLKVEIMTMLIKNEKILAGLQLLISIFLLLVSLFLLSLSYDLIAWAVRKKTALVATRIPSYVPQSAFLFATILFVFYFLQNILKDLLRLARAFGWR